MKWTRLYEQFGGLPLITPQMVYSLGGNWKSLQVQLSRWVKDGKLIKLSRERYVFSKPYQKEALSLFYLANHLVYPSYVSLEYALSFSGFIPEAAFSITSVTPLRPITYRTPVGTFIYRHVKQKLFWGYTSQDKTWNTQMAFPEKALLDLFYFWRGPITRERIEEMRFQNLDQIDVDRLKKFLKKTHSKKLEKIVNQYFIPLIQKEAS